MIYNIDDVAEGNWIVFYLNTGKKCLGKIVNILYIDKEENICRDEIINYIDEDGLNGSVRKDLINKEFSVKSLDMDAFFESKDLKYKPRKSLKHIIKKQENLN